MTHDVFISYSTVDLKEAEAICHILEERKIRCWYAKRDADPGGKWAEDIMNAIHNCNAVVYLISESSNDSKFTVRELTETINLDKKIFPVRIEEVIPSRGVKLLLSTVNWIDAITPPFEEHIINLAKKIQQYLSDNCESCKVENNLLSTEIEKWLSIGETYIEEKQFTEAIVALDRAIKINPRCAKAWHVKGVALFGLSRYDDAYKSFDRAISVDPQNAELWHYKNGVEFLKAPYLFGAQERALAAFEEVIKLNPKNAYAFVGKGVALLSKGRVYGEEALKMFEHAIILDPMCADAWYNKGEWFRKTMNFQKSLEAFDKALEINPKHSDSIAKREKVLKGIHAGFFESMFYSL